MASQRYKLTVAYRGTSYHGWQQQAVTERITGRCRRTGEGIPTIQESLSRDRVGRRATRQARRLVAHRRRRARQGAGRALRHRQDADPARGAAPRRQPRAAGRHPVRSIEPVPDTFDAITSTISKRYQYLIWNQPDRPMFFPDLAWHRWQPLDVAGDARGGAATSSASTTSRASPGPGTGGRTRSAPCYACDVRSARRSWSSASRAAGSCGTWCGSWSGRWSRSASASSPPADIATMLAARDRRAAGLDGAAARVVLAVDPHERTCDDDDDDDDDARTRRAGGGAPNSQPPSTDIVIRSHRGQYAGQLVDVARSRRMVHRERPGRTRHRRANAARPRRLHRQRRGCDADRLRLIQRHRRDRPNYLDGRLAHHHRRGIGRRLIERHRRPPRRQCPRLRVETLGPSVDYEPDAQTRAFYAAMGFTRAPAASRSRTTPSARSCWCCGGASDANHRSGVHMGYDCTLHVVDEESSEITDAAAALRG